MYDCLEDSAAGRAIAALRASKSLIQFYKDNGADVFQKLLVRRRRNKEEKIYD